MFSSVVVAFKAEWCGHCQRLKPELEKAAQIVNEADGLVFATVDINDNPALKEKYGVQGLPTMLLMRPAMEGGLVDTTPENVVEFREGRTATALVALSNRLKHPSVMKFSNANDLIKWVNIPTHHPVKYVLVRNSVEDVSELATSFYNLAKRMQHKLYFGESNPEVISTAYPSLLKKIEEKYTPLIVRIERGVPHYELVTRELLMELSYFEQSLANIKASRFFSALVPKATLNGPELDVVLFTWIVHTHWETYSMLHSQNFYMMSQNPENRYLVIAAVDTNDVEAAAIDSPDKRMSSSYRLHSAVATLSNPSLSNFPSVIRDKFLFGYLDAKHYEEFLEQFGITPDQYPTLLVLDAANSAYWTDATVSDNLLYLYRFVLYSTLILYITLCSVQKSIFIPYSLLFCSYRWMK